MAHRSAALAGISILDGQVTVVQTCSVSLMDFLYFENITPEEYNDIVIFKIQ